MSQAISPEEFFAIFNVDLIIRVGLVASLALYVIFAIFIVRQASLMGHVLHTRFSPLFKTFAYLHLLISLVVLLVVLMLSTF